MFNPMSLLKNQIFGVEEVTQEKSTSPSPSPSPSLCDLMLFASLREKSCQENKKLTALQQVCPFRSGRPPLNGV